MSGGTDEKASLPKPPKPLIKAVDGLLLDALDFEHEVIAGLRGKSPKMKAAELAKVLGLTNLTMWRNGRCAYNKARLKPSYTPHQVNRRLLQLLNGEEVIEKRGRAEGAWRQNRELARGLVQQWWRRATISPQLKLDSIKGALTLHAQALEAAIAKLLVDGELEAWTEAGLPDGVLEPSAPAALMPGGSGEPQAAILRLAATSVDVHTPWPVNLCMVLGVGRLPILAVTVGVDPVDLMKCLESAEGHVGTVAGEPYGRRQWSMGPPGSWPANNAFGAIWSLSAKPSAADLLRAMALAFARPMGACANVLILALDRAAEGAADEILSICAKAREAAEPAPLANLPIYYWRGGLPEGGRDQAVLAHIRSAVEGGLCVQGGSDAAAVFRMRMETTVSLGPAWETADVEQIRLHDLSLVNDAQVNEADVLDEARAVDLVRRAATYRNLLYSLPFAVVSDKVLAAMATSPRQVREVVGLLTPEEMDPSRHPWGRREAEGYRPAQAAIGLFDPEKPR